MPVHRALWVGLSSSLSRCSAPMLVCLISSSEPTMSTVGPADARRWRSRSAIRASSAGAHPAANAADSDPTKSISSCSKGPVSGSRNSAAPPHTCEPRRGR